MEILTDQDNPHSIYKTGEDRAYTSSHLYELEHLRKSELAILTKEFSKDMAYNKAEAEALASEQYKSFISKLSKAKLNSELAENKHIQTQTLYAFYEKRLSLYQSQMKLR
jgi:hypothetical protein